MFDEPTNGETRAQRKRLEVVFLVVFALGVTVAGAFSLGLLPTGRRAPVAGVRGADDTLVAKSRETTRAVPVRGNELVDHTRAVVLSESDGEGDGPRLVERRPTPIDELALAEKLITTHHQVFGEAPTLARISVAWAHLALEHKRGAEVDNHNYGNISVSESAKVPFFARDLPERQRKNAKAALGEWRVVTMRFRAYPDATTGLVAYWTLLRDKYTGALKLFDVGNAHNAGRKLAELGYATAYPEPYAVSMSDLQGEFRRRILPAVEHLDVKKNLEGKLEVPSGDE